MRKMAAGRKCCQHLITSVLTRKTKIYATVGPRPLPKRWAPEICTGFLSALSSAWGKRLGKIQTQIGGYCYNGSSRKDWRAWIGLGGGGQVAGFCECGNEPPVFTKCGEFPDQRSFSRRTLLHGVSHMLHIVECVWKITMSVNLLKPNDIYICRTAALTSRRYILNIYSTNIHTEYFKHAA